MKLPLSTQDPTLEALDEAHKARQTGEKRRKYLGMSSLGKECARELFLGFRWVKHQIFEAETLRFFEDGHRTEDLMAERIKAIEGIELQTQSEEDPDKQIGWEDFGGHLRGHADGIIKGLKQAPKTKHLWENKAVNEKKFDKLVKLRGVNEKLALFQWDPVYYAQQVLYMDYEGLTRSWMTVTTPGGRQHTAVRTEADPAHATKLRAKAENIIFSDYAPDPISDNDKIPPCVWCPVREICRGREAPDRNCRTCAHVEVNRDGTWSCARKKTILDYDAQEAGCEQHRYHPTFVPGELVNASADENWIEYTMKDGSTWRDEG